MLNFHIRHPVSRPCKKQLHEDIAAPVMPDFIDHIPAGDPERAHLHIFRTVDQLKQEKLADRAGKIFEKTEIPFFVLAEHNVAVITQPGQKFFNLGRMILQIVIDPCHDVSRDILESAHQRAVLPEVLGKVYAPDERILFRRPADRVIGTIPGKIIYQNHLQFITVSIVEFFPAFLDQLFDRALGVITGYYYGNTHFPPLFPEYSDVGISRPTMMKESDSDFFCLYPDSGENLVHDFPAAGKRLAADYQLSRPVRSAGHRSYLISGFYIEGEIIHLFRKGIRHTDSGHGSRLFS
jgi:hypothetical protein